MLPLCGMGQRILIVEDEPVLRKHLERLLVREGYMVTAVGSRAEAVQHLARGRFETLLLDVKLPDGDGLDLLAELRERSRPQHTVVMTASYSSETEARAYELNVRFMLRKPLDLRQLVCAVRGVTTRRRGAKLSVDG